MENEDKEKKLVLGDILKKCQQGMPLSDQEVIHLLTRQDERERERIFEVARALREQQFGNRVFLYGFVYFSTHCQNNCSFCNYRQDNTDLRRYRKSREEIVAAAVELKRSGVHLIDLTTGDDPYYCQYPKRLATIIKEVKKATGLPIMVSPGLLDSRGLTQIAQAGADWYALYQETHDQKLFARLRLDQSYRERLAAKEEAAALGLLIEEGLLTGVGDTPRQRLHSLREMGRLQASQLRTMTYVPQEGSILFPKGRADYRDELINIAVMRLVYPKSLIPASLDVEGLKGLAVRLRAGANVVTSIIPSHKGYGGVATGAKEVETDGRTVPEITETLADCGLCAADVETYKDWVASRRKGESDAEVTRYRRGVTGDRSPLPRPQSRLCNDPRRSL